MNQPKHRTRNIFILLLTLIITSCTGIKPLKTQYSYLNKVPVYSENSSSAAQETESYIYTEEASDMVLPETDYITNELSTANQSEQQIYSENIRKTIPEKLHIITGVKIPFKNSTRQFNSLTASSQVSKFSPQVDPWTIILWLLIILLIAAILSLLRIDLLTILGIVVLILLIFLLIGYLSYY